MAKSTVQKKPNKSSSMAKQAGSQMHLLLNNDAKEVLSSMTVQLNTYTHTLVSQLTLSATLILTEIGGAQDRGRSRIILNL